MTQGERQGGEKSTVKMPTFTFLVQALVKDGVIREAVDFGEWEGVVRKDFLLAL